jgi:putative ABC transport system permease protein
MFNPYISYSLENISSIRYILIVCNIVIFFFSIIFIKYANSAFLKTRKKEFGLLYLMGLNNKDIKKIIFLENMTISCIAIISGVLLGVLFSGVFFKVILYALGIKDKIAFVITPISIILTIAIFSVVLLLINISSSKVITKSKIIPKNLYHPKRTLLFFLF